MALLDLATGSLVADPAEVATLLEPTADAGALAAAAGGNAGPIAIRFPTFGDGRGISLAVLLRERHGFKGEIRAVGYLIPDLAQFLLRSGFDTAEIADPAQASVWKASVSRIQHNYQRGYRNPLPLRREASHKEAEALDQRLVRVKSLTDRIREMRRKIEGRIVFSTSLGLEDQAILHAIAEGRRGRAIGRARRRPRLSPCGREPQGVLRDSQSPPAQPGAERRARLDQRLAARAFR
jgi:uncharacterized protein (DUF934 family)